MIFAEVQCPAHVLQGGIAALALSSAFLTRAGADSRAQDRGGASPAGLSALQTIPLAPVCPGNIEVFSYMGFYMIYK